MADEAPRDEVDLSTYLHRLLARWWIVAICIAASIGVALLTGREEGRTSFEARALVTLGLPLTVGGQVVPGAYTNTPTFAQTIVRQPGVQATAATAAGLAETALRGRVSIVPVQAATRTTTPSQVQVVVQGPFGARPAGLAAQSLALQLVEQANAYPTAKRALLEATRARLEGQVEAQQTLLTDTRKGLDDVRASTASTTERAILQQGYLQTIAATTNLLFDYQRELDDAALQLQQIDAVEKARILTDARGVRTDTAAKRASLAVAIALGAVAGILLALLSFVVRPASR